MVVADAITSRCMDHEVVGRGQGDSLWRRGGGGRSTTEDEVKEHASQLVAAEININVTVVWRPTRT
jgi:hypothetical protein